MPHCAIINCKNSSKNCSRTKGNISFHRFPNDPKLKEKWINATGCKDWFPTEFSRMCSLHFEEDCFKGTEKCRRLINTACPTIEVLKTRDKEDSSDQSSTLKGKTPLITPSNNTLLIRLSRAHQQIKEQNLHIKRLRKQNRRKDMKITKLVEIIANLKKNALAYSKKSISVQTTDIHPLEMKTETYEICVKEEPFN